MTVPDGSPANPKRDAELAVLISVLATGAAVLVDADHRILVVVGGFFIQGMIGGAASAEPRRFDSSVRALLRLVTMSPILLMPVLYWVFRQRFLWPMIAAWSSCALGMALVRLKHVNAGGK